MTAAPLTWTSASDDLPADGELVLLYLPRYERRRPNLATFLKGDPNSSGDYFRRDKWLIHSGFASTEQYVQSDQRWARIPTPEGVPAWSGVRLPERYFEPPRAPAPAPAAPPSEPDQPRLFGGAP